MTSLEAGPFVKILLKAIGLSILGFIVLLVLISVVGMATGAGGQLMSVGTAMQDPEAMDALFADGLVVMVVAAIYIGFIFLSVGIFAYMEARQREYILANSSLDGEIKLASTMQARSLTWVSVTNLLAIIVTVGLAIPWASVRMARYVAEHTEVDTSQGFGEYISQRKSEQTSLGDQLGDAFDVDIGIGI